MKEILLTLGMKTLVDDEDYEKLNQWKWYPLIDSSTGNYYVARKIVLNNGKYSTQRMHREIMKTPNGLQCDHINHNTLDNRKSNLRNVTNSQNQMNKSRKSGNKSGYKGVNKHYGEWTASLSKNNKRVYQKDFDTPEDAAHAYDDAAVKYHGEFAKLNFPRNK